MEVSYFNNNTPNHVSFYSSVPRVNRMRTEAAEHMAAYYSTKHEYKLKADKLIIPSPVKKKKKGKSKIRAPLTDRNIKAIKEVYLPPINIPKIKTTTNSVVFPSSPNSYIPFSTVSKMHSPQSTTNMITPLFLKRPDLKSLMDTVKVKKSPRRKGEKKKNPLKSSTSATSLLYAPISQR